ncbi:MAG: hypothetical protein E3J66_00775 [Dehalococcoidia bacterium]|nr:MAG: hypothetical protein E3J66_00775 [Dehalococcoidia bacterium]
MVDCKDAGELLVSYLDGELSTGQKEAVELHLSTCHGCRKDLEALSATQNKMVHSFQVAASKAPSPQAWARLQQRLAGDQQPKLAIFGQAKSKAKARIHIIRQGFVSQQPAWKPALVALLVAALVAALALVISPYVAQSPEVLAAEIAQNDPQVQELLPEGTVIRVVKAIRPVERGIFNVLFLIPGESIWGEDHGDSAVLIDALVDVREKKVLAARALKVEAAHVTPLTRIEKDKAVEIASADPEVQDVLVTGAEIRRVIPLPFFQPSDDTLTITVAGVVLATAPIGSQASVGRWIVEVDLVEERVINIVEYPLK